MPSIALVVLDTLRYDAFRRSFDWLPGRRFSRTYSTSHWTVPAHASLLTGRYASEVGVHARAPALDCPERSLAEAFQSAGYRTRCLTANPQMEQYDGWERGFDEFVPYWSLPAYEDRSFDWGRAFREIDASGVERYLRAVRSCVGADCDTLRSLREGFELYTRSEADGGARSTLDRLRATEAADDELLFVNLMEAHTPYHPPAPGDDPVVVVAADAFRDVESAAERARHAYRASVDYLSRVYRELFAELRAEYDYVVTLSDHGELLGEHGMVNHSFGLHPELLHVPLAISGPDVDAGVDDRVASLLDVHRTVADLADLEVTSRGQNLLVDDHDDRDYCFEYHGPLPFHEAQFERKGVDRALYEYRTEPLSGYVTADGDYVYETHGDGLRTIGEPSRDPDERLEELTAAVQSREIESSEHDVAPDVQDRLEDLGYA